MSKIATIYRMRHIQLALYLSLAITSVGFGQPAYTIQEIPPIFGNEDTGACKINDNGTVLGYLALSNADYRPILFKNGVATQIGGGINGICYGMNNSDTAVGQAQFAPGKLSGAIFGPTSATDLAANRTGLEYIQSTALAINDRSAIVGLAVEVSGKQSAVRFLNGRAVQVLPNPPGTWSTASANHINALSVIVGTVANNGGGNRAVRWLPNNTVAVLDSQDQNAVAFAINNSGNSTGYVADQIAFWRGDTLRLLGKIPGSTASYGLDINESNTIVGAFETNALGGALLYQNGQIYDLQQCLVNGAGWVLGSASGINNLGQIVGTGRFNGLQRGFLLTPQ